MKHTPVTAWRQQRKNAPRIGRQGKILEWTLIRLPAASFKDQAPYPVVIAEMTNGERVIGQLVDWQQDDLRKGRKVVSVLRRMYTNDAESVIQYILKLKPV